MSIVGNRINSVIHTISTLITINLDFSTRYSSRLLQTKLPKTYEVLTWNWYHNTWIFAPKYCEQ